MKIAKIAKLLLLSAVVFQSCQKEQAEVKEGSEMKFFASFNKSAATKGATEFPSGNKATIFCYSGGSNPSSASPVSGTPLEATATSSGSLTPQTPLYLPKGSYDFYSVSSNTSSSPGLTFSGGVSQQLSNGVDYLWASQSSVSEGGIVYFPYLHRAVSLEISVVAGEGVSSMSVTSIKFTPSKPSSNTKMNLLNGEIGSAVQTDALTSFPVVAGKASAIMLPLSNLPISVEVTINGTIGGVAVSGKTYSTSLPAREYSGGTMYLVQLTVSANAITFSGSTIEEWTTQTIDGITLTEQ